MLKAIETTYRGYRFRSRLEARWAVFFDAVGLEWEYEPEGFQLPSGRFYLPDFRVMNRLREVFWFEIKPGDEAENEAFTEFMRALPEIDIRGAVLNNIPDPRYVEESSGCYYDDHLSDRPYMLSSSTPGYWDNCYRFCICATCGIVGFEFDGRSARIGCGCDIHKDSDRNHTADHPKIVAAFAKARAARFEHDEREAY